MSGQYPMPPVVERLAYLGERVTKVAHDDPALASSERVSLILAAEMIARVHDQQVAKAASLN
jgi:hypothetical protein